MIIVGENLKQLMIQEQIVNDPNCFDETCLSLSLNDTVKYLLPSKQVDQMITYGEALNEELIKTEEVPSAGIIFKKKSTMLACTFETIKIPKGYMGFLQTKGTLARLFVMTNFSDGQVDAGFNGKLTLEMYNASEFDIKIPKRARIVNLYILKASTKNHKLYTGKYKDATEPTHSLFL